MSGHVRNWYGQVVRAKRTQLDLTQEDLAIKTGLGIQRDYIAKLETGQVQMPRTNERREAIARVFGVTHREMEAEARRLEAVDRGGTVRVPRVRDYSSMKDQLDDLVPSLSPRQLEHLVGHVEFMLGLDDQG